MSGEQLELVDPPPRKTRRSRRTGLRSFVVTYGTRRVFVHAENADGARAEVTAHVTAKGAPPPQSRGARRA